MESVDLNYGQIFFMTLGFLSVVSCVPCWVIAKFIYEPYVKKLAEEEEEPIPYEYQYPLINAEDNGEQDRDFKKCYCAYPIHQKDWYICVIVKRRKGSNTGQIIQLITNI